MGGEGLKGEDFSRRRAAEIRTFMRTGLNLFVFYILEMSKTDRQTDTKLKSTWWICTAYNENLIKLKDVNTYPKFVTKVHGGPETCPTTGREHFQGAIQCVSQVRMSSLLAWLPGCHLEVAKSAEAVRKYCMKSETASGEKIVRSNPNQYYSMHDLLTNMATVYNDKEEEMEKFRQEKIGDKDINTLEYWLIAKYILQKEPHLITSFSDNRYKTAWIYTKDVWVELSKRALSITEPVTEKVQENISGINIEHGSERGSSDEARCEAAWSCSDEEEEASA